MKRMFPKRNFDEIDASAFNNFSKRNLDEADEAALRRYFAKRNFDEIDAAGFNDFSKRNLDEAEEAALRRFFAKRNFDEIDAAGFNDFSKKSSDDFDGAEYREELAKRIYDELDARANERFVRDGEEMRYKLNNYGRSSEPCQHRQESKDDKVHKFSREKSFATWLKHKTHNDLSPDYEEYKPGKYNGKDENCFPSLSPYPNTQSGDRPQYSGLADYDDHPPRSKEGDLGDYPSYDSGNKPGKCDEPPNRPPLYPRKFNGLQLDRSPLPLPYSSFPFRNYPYKDIAFEDIKKSFRGRYGKNIDGLKHRAPPLQPNFPF